MGDTGPVLLGVVLALFALIGLLILLSRARHD